MIELAQAMAPGVPRDVWEQVQVSVRAEVGGTDGGYIRKDPAARRAHGLGQALRTGASVSQAMQMAGVPQSTAYRILSRPLTRRR